MLKRIIKQVFDCDTYTIQKMDKGLTNHNYLLTIENKQYVVRMPRSDSEHMINRKHEYEVSKIVRDLDVKTIYFDKESGIKISEYVDHLYEFDTCPYEDKIERCAKLLKKLHALPNVAFPFDPFATLKNYQAHVKDPYYDLSFFEAQIQKVKQFNNPHVLCHNDLVAGNILYGEKRDYLIDYEYAGSNDPLFDVISFLSENQIFDENLRERFYAAYFTHLDDATREQLYLWEVFQNVLWCYWAMMMEESRNEAIYKQIAKDKYEALLRMKQ